MHRMRHIQGGEKEYGIMPNVFLEGKYHAEDIFFASAPLYHSNGGSVGIPPGDDRRKWLTNMGRLYIDTGDHPEYASPECATPRDAVIWQKAGDRILADIVDAVNAVLWKAISDGTIPERMTDQCMEMIRTYVREYALSPGSEILRIYRNSIDGLNDKMFSDHENHIIQRSVDIEQAYGVLLIHCISRIIWQGSGVIVHNPEQKKYEYHLSQRGCHIENLIDGITTDQKKPIIHTKDEPHADIRDWRRIHMIGGDANMSEIASRLKYGTTMMLILMIEDGFFDEQDLSENHNTLLRCYRQFSCDSTLRVRQQALGVMHSALDLQRMLLGYAQEYFAVKNYGPLTEEITWQLEWWQKILDSAAGPDPLLRLQRYTDHAKYALIVADMKKHNYSWCSSPDKKLIIRHGKDSTVRMTVQGRLKYLDIEYHRISHRFGMFQRLPMERICADEEITYAVQFPPPNTRACARRAITQMCDEQPNWRVKQIDWTTIEVDTGGHYPIKRELLDPFNSRAPSF